MSAPSSKAESTMDWIPMGLTKKRAGFAPSGPKTFWLSSRCWIDMPQLLVAPLPLAHVLSWDD